MKKNKGVFITEKKFMSLIHEITAQEQKEMAAESFSSEIMLMVLLASSKALLELKSRIFEDNDEE